ncbi:MAG: PAS domain S-box protein [Gemmataceae bacterium]
MNLVDDPEIARCLFREAIDAYFLLDPEDCHILDVNPAAQRLTGMRRKALLEQTLEELFTTSGTLKLAPLVQGLRTTTESGLLEGYAIRNAAGRQVPVQITVSRIHTSERVLGLMIVRDLSERERAAQMLRERDDRFRRMLEGIGAVLWELDARSEKLQYIAPQVERLLGYPAERWYEPGFWEAHLHPDDRKMVMEANRRQTGEGKNHLLEYRMLAADGRVVWILDAVHVEKAAGAERLIMGFLVDITERKQAEKALRYSEHRFHMLFDHSPDAIFVEDLEGWVLEVNQAACRLHGLTASELVGRHVSELVPAENREEVRARFAALVAGTLQTTEGISLRADGTQVAVELSAALIAHEGAPALLIHARDIQARREAEQSLEESRRFIERVARLSPNIIYVFDIQKQVNIYANRMIGEVLGYSPEEIQAMGTEFLPRLTHPDDLRQLAALLNRWKTVEDGTTVETEYRMRARNGKWHWFIGRDTVFARDAAGRVLQIIGTAEDITTRKLAAEEVLASKRMLEMVINHIPQGVFWKDRTSRYLGCNQVVAAQAGLGSPAELVGRTDFELPSLSTELATSFVEADQAVMQSGESSLDVVYRVPLTHGSTVWLQTSKIPLQDAEGQSIGVLGTWQDITEQRNYQDAIEQRNQLLAALSRIQGQFLTMLTLEPTFEEMLTTLLERTGSVQGYLCEVLTEEQGAPFVRSYSMQRDQQGRPAGMAPPCQLPLAELPAALRQGVEQGRPVFMEALEAVFGLPESRAGLVVPFLHNHQVIGLVGMGDRAQGYDARLVEFLEPFFSTCTSMIVAIRAQRARQQAEETLRTALDEKRALLREIHHRVKNNLQIITSMINLQEAQNSTATFAETRNRIRSMALLHETLYRTENLARIDLRQYVRGICSYLLRSYGSDPTRIALEQEVHTVSLDLDRAIPCGLILNELISNALKHAFPGGRRGRVEVRIVQEGRTCMLTVRDDGVGLPAETEQAGARSLGLRLVHDLTRQLNGTLATRSEAGTSITITFQY